MWVGGGGGGGEGLGGDSLILRPTLGYVRSVSGSKIKTKINHLHPVLIKTEKDLCH